MKVKHIYVKYYLDNPLRQQQLCSVASFLVWGGGGAGKTPKCTDRGKKKSCTCNLYARASEASERLRNIYMFRSQNTSACTYNHSMQFPFITYGAINGSILIKH